MKEAERMEKIWKWKCESRGLERGEDGGGGVMGVGAGGHSRR